MRSEQRGLVYSAIDIERRIQERLKAEGRFKYSCADAEMSSAEKMTVLGEEIGEVGHEINEGIGAGRAVDLVKLRKELVQVAAVAVAWIESLDAEIYQRETVFNAVDCEIAERMPQLVSLNAERYTALYYVSGLVTKTLVTGFSPIDSLLGRVVAVCVQWVEALDAELEHAAA